MGRWVLIAVLVVLLGLLSLSPIGVYDCWTHLAAGRTICEEWAVPRQDPFSWTYEGAEWVDHEWLFQVVAYGIYRVGGVSGLVVAKTVVLVAAFGLLLDRLPRFRSEEAPVRTPRADR